MPGFSNNGLNNFQQTSTTAGVQICLVGTAASATIQSGAQGLLAELTISADSAAQTITFYDGTSTSGTVIYKVVTPTTVPVTELFPNRAFRTGLFMALSGGSTIQVKRWWRGLVRASQR